MCQSDRKSNSQNTRSIQRGRERDLEREFERELERELERGGRNEVKGLIEEQGKQTIDRGRRNKGT